MKPMNFPVRYFAPIVGLTALTMTGIHAQTKKANSNASPPIAQVKKEDHVSAFLEDPFITKYRKKFFSVFQGKFGEFEGGMTELEAMLKKNPHDARALVWHGNGLTVRAGLQKMIGKGQDAVKLLTASRKELDRAVNLSPDDVNIIAMRAVTIHTMGQYWKPEEVPAGSWELLIADLEKTRQIIGKERFPKISVHARGEILTELADGYQRVGKNAEATALWKETLVSVPNSRYATMAEKALAAQKQTAKVVSP